MTTPAHPPLCASCERYRGFDAGHERAYYAAFSNGIPAEIIVDGFDHREPFAGDGGIRYVPDPTAGPLLAGYLAGQGAK